MRALLKHPGGSDVSRAASTLAPGAEGLRCCSGGPGTGRRSLQEKLGSRQCPYNSPPHLEPGSPLVTAPHSVSSGLQGPSTPSEGRVTSILPAPPGGPEPQEMLRSLQRTTQIQSGQGAIRGRESAHRRGGVLQALGTISG